MMKPKHAYLLMVVTLLLSGISLIPIPYVQAVAVYTYDGSDIYITGATANFAGWYAADQAGGWGTIGRSSTNDYYLDSNNVVIVYIGNSTDSCTFYDWSKQVDFDTVYFEIANGSTLTLGRVHPSTGNPQNAMQIIANVETKVLAGGTLNLYACSISGGVIISESDNQCEFYGCQFDSVELSIKNMDMDKCVLNLAYFDGSAYEVGGNVTNLFHHRGFLVHITDNYNISIENTVCSVTNILTTVPTETWTGNCNLTDVTSNSWLIGWDGTSDTGVLWRKNTYDLTVTFPNGTTVNGTLTGARVVIQHYGQGGAVDYNATLGDDGTIPSQQLIVGFYNATGDDTIYDYNTYNLQVYNVTGYAEYNGNFTLSNEIEWTVILTTPVTYTSAILVASLFLIVPIVVVLFVWRWRS